MSRAAEARPKIEAYGIENICDDIIDGKSYRDIAQSLGVGTSSLHAWLAVDPERSARARAALTESAMSCDDEALAVLKDPQVDPARAREIASHLRWRARVRDQAKYGEKLQVDQRTEVINLSAQEIARQRAEIQKKLDAAKAAGLLPAPGVDGESS